MLEFLQDVILRETKGEMCCLLLYCYSSHYSESTQTFGTKRKYKWSLCRLESLQNYNLLMQELHTIEMRVQKY